MKEGAAKNKLDVNINNNYKFTEYNLDNEMKIHGYTNVFLDITHMPSSYIKERFPTIYKKCLTIGIDITR